MRLIDADALKLDFIAKLCGHGTCLNPTGQAEVGWMIDEAKTIDAVPVVRCKDCKNWNRHICTFDSPNGYCDAHEEMTNGYDFCSYGERIDNG